MNETPLSGRIRRLIEADGPLTVAQYMALCLGDPQHGYYTTRDPFGPAGDFTTAPEVSQIFGEIVGAWLIHAWRLCGAPSPVTLAELGPGRGTLMSDILRVARRAPEFVQAASVWLVEINTALRPLQAKALADAPVPVAWGASLDDVPEGPLLLVANEFFDALPIRQFVLREREWRERVVGLDSGGALAFGIGAARLGDGPKAPEGTILEISPAGEAVAATIARRVVEHGGAALLIDYGHAGASPSPGTLQAVRGHGFAEPLTRPGETDLTAHVDFGALGRATAAAGAQMLGPIAQGEFLLALGLKERAGQLGQNAGDTARAALAAAVARLARPDQMGNLFKVAAITRPAVALPPFAP